MSVDIDQLHFLLLLLVLCAVWFHLVQQSQLNKQHMNGKSDREDLHHSISVEV